jgi:3-deoxy-D-manno-octulosonate 8-phosphate phosphatase (KDO 8-P phosphatase)
MDRTLRERALAIELLVLDVDGVLTGGEIIYGTLSGEMTMEIKPFHVRDGSALKYWHEAGKTSALITGRMSAIIEWRAAELGITHVQQGMHDKREGLHRLIHETGFPTDAICYIGDDLFDVPAMQQVGLALTVADACSEARTLAHYITQAKGGQAAVREAIERILRVQEKWPLTIS